MEMQMQMRNGGDDYYRNQQLDRSDLLMESSPPPHSSVVKHPLSATSSSSGYIEHTVTKFDTLAGVAIKYGVEVADIKRMNGLTTDLQMFSRKTLQIPLPGRHPPSPILSNGYDTHGPKRSNMTPPNHRHSDLFDSIKSLKLSSSSPRIVSPSMDALRDYYGLKQTNQNGVSDRVGPGALSLEQGPKQPETSNLPHGLHRKSKSLACEVSETGVKNDETPVTNSKKPDYNTWYDKLMRGRRSEINLQNHTPETMLKPDTTNTTTAFSPAAGKGLALRPKAANRTSSDADGPQIIPPLKLGDSVVTDTSSGVKKSSSSPSFQESFSSGNNGTSTSTSSIWPTSMLNLTADLQALSTAAITRPMFDGLPKPMSGRKNKAAID